MRILLEQILNIAVFIVKDTGIEAKFGHASEQDFQKSDLKTKIILSKSDLKERKKMHQLIISSRRTQNSQ